MKQDSLEFDRQQLLEGFDFTQSNLRMCRVRKEEIFYELKLFKLTIHLKAFSQNLYRPDGETNERRTSS
ncbi:hypothetical protein G3567_09355 [Psychroflexus sp. YR1-1]|uniref:Uncharacterized protein n=1 Tax=Psychroflexus aurantiacus TaxID=2709310 RepID=A0A6B3R2U0_9FLAO|nr:hypothetical protein [Psychroflexus aurantiacus]NEV94348.1 hypothetical protein [Psychroflexus aurantiacus]